MNTDITLIVRDGVIHVYGPDDVKVTLVDFDVDPQAMSDVRTVKLCEEPYEAVMVGVIQFDACPMGEIDIDTRTALLAFQELSQCDDAILFDMRVRRQS